jgi:hypothetical protein
LLERVCESLHAAFDEPDAELLDVGDQQ